MKKFFEEFKTFAMRGNVIDMAVGVVIGGAFGKITTSIVNDIIMPLISMLTGGVDFSQWKWVLKEAVTEVGADGALVETAAEVSVKFGNTIAVILDFIIIAFAVFCMVKALNNLHKKKEEPAPEPAPPAPTTEELLVEKNKVMNLTAITEPHDVATLHFLDSVAMLTLADLKGKKMADIGTGAGFPGMPLRIVEPSLRLTLLDSLNKRIDFLKEVCADLGLNDVECIHGRAEEFAANHREDYDIVTSRAVANLQMLSELCLPLVKVGGYFLSMKAVDSEEEANAAKNAIKTLGGQIEKVVDYAIPGTDVQHRLIFIKKIKETPKKYPRAFAKIKKNPL